MFEFMIAVENANEHEVRFDDVTALPACQSSTESPQPPGNASGCGPGDDVVANFVVDPPRRVPPWALICAIFAATTGSVLSRLVTTETDKLVALLAGGIAAIAGATDEESQ